MVLLEPVPERVDYPDWLGQGGRTAAGSCRVAIAGWDSSCSRCSHCTESKTTGVGEYYKNALDACMNYKVIKNK